jgi:hypothetical protein
LSLWRELQDALIGWRWTCQLLPQSCAAQACIFWDFCSKPSEIRGGQRSTENQEFEPKNVFKRPKKNHFLIDKGRVIDESREWGTCPDMSYLAKYAESLI